MSEEQFKQLDVQASKEDRSKGSIVREALKMYLESKEGK